jgi:hypothetical protein
MMGGVLYLAITVPFVALAAVLYGLGVSVDAGLSLALLSAIASAIVAMIDIRRIYYETPIPRSFFFGMLVSALEVKIAFGSWVGYLVAASLLAKVGILLPLPPQAVRSVITGIAAVVLLVSAVYYDLSIRIEERRLRALAINARLAAVHRDHKDQQP